MDMPSLSGDMSIFCAIEWADSQCRGHAHSFRGTCSFFAARSGHMANMSRLRSVGRACPVQPGAAWASRGTCSVFRCVPGQPKGHAHGFRSSRLARADMPILSGTCLPFRGTCPFIVPLGGLVASAGDMLILSAEHAHFSRQGVGIWPVRATCPIFPRDMLIFRG